MNSPYDLITISRKDLLKFKEGQGKNKVQVILNLIFEDMPRKVHLESKFVNPKIVPIEGFEDDNVIGYKIIVEENKRIENYISKFIPFLLLKK